jgi:hypothetical protein
VVEFPIVKVSVATPTTVSVGVAVIVTEFGIGADAGAM